MKLKFQSPTGMHDILAEDHRYFSKIRKTVKKIVEFYNFQRVETPILEETELFSKGIGLDTDVVDKEMFSLKTKGGDKLTLRPEGTAPAVRAYLEDGMASWPRPVKLWYFGPFFRYEKPQAGRFRQFWQFGFEVIGEDHPVRDAEVVQIFYKLLKKLKIKDLMIEVNSIGDSCCRPYYKKLLGNYLKPRSASLCANCRKRIKKNPIRALDCKEEKCRRVISQAPQIIDHLCQDCHQHFKQFLEFLDQLEIPYRLNPYLVRGLDYYTRTVFEVFSSTPTKPGDEESEDEGFSEAPKNALGGGGRYDGLVKILGGKETPAVGAAGGIDRIVSLMKSEGITPSARKEPRIFLAQLGNLAKRKSLKIMEDFRKARIPVLESLGKDSLRAQLKMADKTGIKYALVMGQKEALEDKIMLRNMETGRQSEIKLEKLVKEVKKLLK
jgi:histidyl-tRNA synthetase